MLITRESLAQNILVSLPFEGSWYVGCKIFRDPDRNSDYSFFEGYESEHLVDTGSLFDRWAKTGLWTLQFERHLKMSSKPWHHPLPPNVNREHHPNALTHRFFHPTHAVLSHPNHGELTWSSRAHRKHRYRTHATPSGKPRHGDTPFERLWHLTRVEYWNISWWVAIVRSISSSLHSTTERAHRVSL